MIIEQKMYKCHVHNRTYGYCGTGKGIFVETTYVSAEYMVSTVLY
jgi:hypothetical protein